MPSVIQILAGQMDMLAATVERTAARVDAARKEVAQNQAGRTGGNSGSNTVGGITGDSGSGWGNSSESDLLNALANVPNGPGAAAGRT